MGPLCVHVCAPVSARKCVCTRPWMDTHSVVCVHVCEGKQGEGNAHLGGEATGGQAPVRQEKGTTCLGDSEPAGLLPAELGGARGPLQRRRLQLRNRETASPQLLWLSCWLRPLGLPGGPQKRGPWVLALGAVSAWIMEGRWLWAWMEMAGPGRGSFTGTSQPVPHPFWMLVSVLSKPAPELHLLPALRQPHMGLCVYPTGRITMVMRAGNEGAVSCAINVVRLVCLPAASAPRKPG